MEATHRLDSVWPRAVAALNPGAIAAWLLPLAAILYLGLNNGGYGVIERAEVGMIAAWVFLIGALAGVLSVGGNTVAGRIGLVALLAFVLWTAASLVWTESAERTMVEVGRVGAYLSVFALALGLQRPGFWRPMLHGATCGVAIVSLVGVLSWLDPSLFATGNPSKLLPSIEGRLSYPLNYTSGIGGFAALSLPLLLGATASARSILGQALSAAMIPACGLAIWLSASGLSLPIAVIGILVWLALSPDRLPKLVTLLVSCGGAAILFAALGQRDALDAGLNNAAAQQQGEEMMVFLVIVCAGVALLQASISIFARFAQRPTWMQVPKHVARRGALAVAALLAAAAVGFLLSGEATDAFDRFKDSAPTDFTESRASQILDYGSSGRYEFWNSAVEAGETDALTGIGAGGFEAWWAQEGTSTIFIRDAHSLFFETFAELGMVGLLLIGGLCAFVLIVGAARALRATVELRTGLAAATAGALTFVIAAGVDWMWELAVLPAVFLVLAAILLAGSDTATAATSPPSRRFRIGALAVAGIVALSLFAVNLVLLGGTESLRTSQLEARQGNLDAALAAAVEAERIQPYGASAQLQQALILEELGELEAASQAATEATANEPENWRNWLILSRIEALNNNPDEALAAYREAKSLNPRSSLFQ